MRLFTAVEIPQKIRAGLAALRDDTIPGARWVRTETFHLTLRFIGESTDADLARYKAGLVAVAVEPFDLMLAGVGKFPPSDKKAPRVLWVGVEANPALIDLQARVEGVLQSAGLPPDSHAAYNPHITLARLKTHLPATEAHSFLARQAEFRTEPFRVTQFTLMQSKLTPHGAIYTRLSLR